MIPPDFISTTQSKVIVSLPSVMNGTAVNIENGYDHTAALVVGVFYIFSSSVILCIYAFVISVIVKDEDMMRRSCYRIMLAMGVSDIVQVVFVGLFSGVYTLANSTFGFVCNKITGGILNSFWIATTALGSSLAVDRYLAVANESARLKYFGGKRVYYWIAFSYFYAFLFFISYMCPHIEVIYFPQLYVWYYNDDFPSQVVSDIEVVSDSLANILMFGFYIAIGINLRRIRRQSSTAKLSRKERNALLQSFIVCFSIMIYVVVWFGVPVVTDNKWAIFSVNVVWILMVGVNGCLYLIFNQSVRRNMANRVGMISGYFSKSAVGTPVQPINITFYNK